MNIGFVFDMDGTIVDNMHYHELAWQAILAERGVHCTIDEIRLKAYGSTPEAYARFFSGKVTEETLEIFGQHKEAQFRKYFAPHFAPIPGLIPFMEKAYALGIPMAIATGSMRKNCDWIVDKLGVRALLTAIVTADDVEHGKPDPEIFFKAAHQIGIASENCIVFEDVPSGGMAAFNGGMRSVILTTTYPAFDAATFASAVKAIENYTQITPEEFLV